MAPYTLSADCLRGDGEGPAAAAAAAAELMEPSMMKHKLRHAKVMQISMGFLGWRG